MTAPALVLRPMREGDLDAVLAVEPEMFGTEAWTRNGYRAELADRRRRNYVAAELDGALAGWAGVLLIGESAEILTVGVLPAARRRGIARALLAALLDEVVPRGAVECFLEVREDNVAARAVYRSEGFEELGVRRGYYDGGRVDAVTMRLDLSARRNDRPSDGGATT